MTRARRAQAKRRRQVHPAMQPAYASAGFAADAFPIATRIANTTLSLPMGPHLAPDQVAKVVDVVCHAC